MGLFDDGLDSRERIREKVDIEGLELSISPSGQIFANSFEIPYRDLPWLFETYGKLVDDLLELDDQGQITHRNRDYTLQIGSDDYGYSCRESKADDDEVEEFFSKNGMPHCTIGPAIVTPSYISYCLDGSLHNTDGPALSRLDSSGIHDTKYALDGVIYELSDYVENHPEAQIKRLAHNNKFITVSKVSNRMVVRAAGHVFTLLKDIPGVQMPKDGRYFLLESLYKSPNNYSIIDYKPPSKEYEKIYTELSKVTDFIEKPTEPGVICFSGTYDNRGIVIKHNKKTDDLVCKFHEYDNVLDFKSSKTETIKTKLDATQELGFYEEDLLVPKNRLLTKEYHRNIPFETNMDEDKQLGFDFLKFKERDDKYSKRKEEIESIVNQLKTDWSEPIEIKTFIIDPEGVDLLTPLETDDAFKKEFAKRFTEITKDLDKYLESAFGQALSFDSSKKVYGVSIPPHIYDKAHYNPSDNSYYWVNEKNEFHSPETNLPAIILPDGELLFYENGFLHRESGPAIQNIYDREKDEWVLWGVPLSKEELEHYNPRQRAIEFKNEKGQYHRKDGPAVIVFEDDNTVTELYYDNGTSTHSVRNVKRNSKFERNAVPARKPKVVKVTNNANSNLQYTELNQDEIEALKAIFRDHIDQIKEYEDEIHEAAKQVMISKGIPFEEKPKKVVKVVTKESEMTNLETQKKVRSAPDLTGTRTNQLVNGFKFGFKKGVVNNSSHLLAEKVATLTPLEGNEWFERFLQICFLLGAAEMLERMPEGMGEKLRLHEDLRRDAASIFRYISGENIGRDIVDVAANVLPLFAQVLKEFTAEELKDLSEDLETQIAEEEETDAFTSNEEEFDFAQDEEVKHEVHQEVVA